MIVRIEELESEVMAMLLHGDIPFLETLRRQYSQSTISKREFSGVGFFTTFAVPRNVMPADPPHFELTDVGLELENVRHGAGVILFVKDGYLNFLEGFAYDDPWPDEPAVTSIYYLSASDQAGKSVRPSKTRDLRQLMRELTERRNARSA